MNDEILKGQWKQVRGRAKEWWGKLTDDDLDKVEGKTERLVGVLQEKYGYAKEKAEDEISRRMIAYRATSEKPNTVACAPQMRTTNSYETERRKGFDSND